MDEFARLVALKGTFMTSDTYPNRPRLPHDPYPKKTTTIDLPWTLQHVGRAQRREILRQLKQFRRQGVPGADEELRSYATAGPNHA